MRAVTRLSSCCEYHVEPSGDCEGLVLYYYFEEWKRENLFLETKDGSEEVASTEEEYYRPSDSL